MRNGLHAPRPARKALLEAQQLEPRQLMTVTFGNTDYIATGQGGPATITLQESAGLGVPGVAATATQGSDVAYVSTAGGTAVAGVDYTPVNETVTFEPGQTSQTVQIPVLPAPASDGTRILDLTISSSPGGAPTSEAFLIISHSADTTPPTIVATKALTKGPDITGFVLTFSKAMAPGPVQDVSNYAVVNPHSYHVRKRKQWLTSATVPLSSAVYDPTTDSVTLTLAHRIKKSPIITITDSQSEQEMNVVGENAPTASELLPAISPITDTTGNPMAGSPVSPSEVGHFYVEVGLGKLGKRIAGVSNAPLMTAPPGA
jgi:hypothetical protein